MNDLRSQQLSQRQDQRRNSRKSTFWKDELSPVGLLALAFVLFCPGCTTLSLKRQIVSHAESVNDVRYREVMENLAMVYANPAALPAYCSIYYGTTDVTDSISVSPGTTWSQLDPKKALPFLFTKQTLDLNTSRAIKKNWNLDPTIVPEKLKAMRCACWWVLFGPENNLGDSMILEQYERRLPDGSYFAVANDLRSLPVGWLKRGSLVNVPPAACYQAVCRDRCVWVEPSGMDGLSAFTLIIQKIARATPNSTLCPGPSTRTVVLSAADHNSLLCVQNEPTLKTGDACPPEKIEITKVTVYVDNDGFVTPGDKISSIPRKVRFDNVGVNSELKSSLSASAKGP